MLEIKDQVREKLQTINDTDFLCALLDLMNNINQKGQYQFSKSQLEDINESIEQISNGEFVTHDEWKQRFQK